MDSQNGTEGHVHAPDDKLTAADKPDDKGPGAKPKGEKSSITAWSALVVSIISLAVSAYQQFHEDHDLRAIVTLVNTSGNSPAVKILVSNVGNRTEVVDDIHLGLDTGQYAVGKKANQQLILKPGDAKVLEVSAANFDLVSNLKKVKLIAYFYVVDTRRGWKDDAIFIETKLPIVDLALQDGRIASVITGPDEVKVLADLYDGSRIN
jgi:hypothetical protein